MVLLLGKKGFFFPILIHWQWFFMDSVGNHVEKNLQTGTHDKTHW